MIEQPPIQSPEPSRSSQRDLEHLRVLSILHYVFGGLSLLGICGSVIYLVFGTIILSVGPENMPDVQDDEAAAMQVMGVVMVVLGGCITVLLLVWGVATLIAGYSLNAHKNLTLCYVVAVINCLSIPLGTLLSIFTFIVLSRPSVRQLFEQQRAQTEEPSSMQ